MWGFPPRWWKCSGIQEWWWMHDAMNILKPAELYTLRGWTLWYVNYIPIKLLLKKSYGTPSCLLLVSRGDGQKHKDRHIQIASLHRISPELIF